MDSRHHRIPSQVVSRNFNNAPAIHLFPSDGVGVGVALTECMRPFSRGGVANPHVSIPSVLPPEVWGRALERPRYLYIAWPGYQHLRWKHRLTFMHPDRTPYTIGEMAYQVAVIWVRFIAEHGDDFRGPGIRLGSRFVSFNHIRLHAIYTGTGNSWQAEVSYMPPT